MEIINRKVDGPCRDLQVPPISKVNLLQLTPNPERQALSDHVVEHTNRLALGKQFQSSGAFLAVSFHSKMLHAFGKAKGQLNRATAIGANLLENVERRRSRYVRRNAGLRYSVTNIVCADRKSGV